MPTTDGYNGAYTGPEIDKGIARANQSITVTGSGTASMSETLGSGPYTIEFTEEASSGGGSLPDGSAGQILGYVEDNVVGPIMSKSDLLSAETAALYGLGADAVPDSVLKTSKGLIDKAQNAANTANSVAGAKATISSGSRSPTNTNSYSISFSFVPKLIVLKRKGEATSLVYGAPTFGNSQYTTVSWGSSTVTITVNSSYSNDLIWNNSGSLINYIGIG